ncbi:MAG TPA: RNA polymerase sigma factor [Candidatus Polarisedimenticolaceae bacterium]
MTDAELLESIHADAPGAFEAFVEAYGDRVYRFGRRMCGDREDAQDVLQDTLIAAYRALKTVEHPEALRSWIYRVASNACLMMRRKGRHEPERELSLEELMPTGPDGPRAEIPDPAMLPDSELAQAEVVARVRAAIGDLPPGLRIVLVMRDMEGLSTQEVGAALGIGESAVKMRLHRARLHLRRLLASSGTGALS